MVLAMPGRNIREIDFEKAQPTWDYHWCCVVDGGADLSSAVT
jgi:hypothetical protein